MDEVPARIEHTLCGPMTTWTDAANALDAAMREGMAVCLPPCHVAGAAEYAPAVDLTTVVGHPPVSRPRTRRSPRPGPRGTTAQTTW